MRRGLVLAPTLMFLTGLYTVLLGADAYVRQPMFSVNVPSVYLYNWTVRGWGWTFLVLGGLGILASFALFTGMAMARIASIVLASAISITGFFFVPYNGLWSFILIAMSVFVIWAASLERGGLLGLRGGMQQTVGYGDQYREREYGREAGQYRETGQAPDMVPGRERWPAENVGAGRHWTPEPAREGSGMGTGMGAGVGRAEAGQASQGAGQVGSETPEHAAAAARSRAAQAAQEASQQQRRNAPGSRS